jgi:NTP pyrophosphatase (non-canonical NTP hydrolase)
MESGEMVRLIREKIPMTELMAGLAEEASELAQAALKLRRVWTQTNPTPKREDDAQDDLFEEIADVFLYLEMIGIQPNFPGELITGIKKQKIERWAKRLEG